MVVVIDKDKGYKRIFNDIKQLDGRGVKVGLFGGEENDGVSVVDYAVYNEFGTSRIPARPFMQTTADKYRDEIMKFSSFLVGKMIDGQLKPDRVLRNLGEEYKKKIQSVIRDAKDWAEPNAASTVAQKGSSSPLIDSGRMVNAVNYELIGGGAKSSGGETKEGSGSGIAKVAARLFGAR